MSFCINLPGTNEILLGKVSKGAKIRNRYNQVPHLTQDTNGKVTNSHEIMAHIIKPNNEGSGEPAQMRILAIAFSASIHKVWM